VKQPARSPHSRASASHPELRRSARGRPTSGTWAVPAALALLLAALLATAGCSDGCGTSDALAELSALAGPRIERDAAGAEGQWRSARPHDRFKMGDGLRTGPNSKAELHLFPSGVAHVEPHTLLRFLASAPSTQGVALESGAVEIVAGQMDLEIHTPRAVARLTRGSKVKLSAAEGRERFDLVVGRVFVSHDEIEQALQPREPLELGPAQTREPTAAPADSGPADTSTKDAEPLEEGRLAAAEVQLHPLGRAELTLLAVETSTIHAPQLPVEVRLALPPCASGGKVLLSGKPLSTSERDGLLRLPAGRHRLRVLCGADVARESQIVVKRDAAKLELPKRAQSVRVEADGRRYTVLYQNLLPIVSFVWPGNHEGSAFTLLLRRGKHEQSFALTRPEHALAGNALGEGEHKFWFRDQAGRSSRPGSVRLTFDNAARSAYLSSPR
jgi:hypothetical protein